jgi:hypothetical protein
MPPRPALLASFAPGLLALPFLAAPGACGGTDAPKGTETPVGDAAAGCSEAGCVDATPGCTGADCGEDATSIAEGGVLGFCTEDADCPSGARCGFLEADHCSGVEGTCFQSLGAICNAIAPGCACDGSFVNVACTGLPNGYASKPLLHTGPCD